MRARPRVTFVAAAILFVLLALPLVLQTPWVKGHVLRWASGWIRDQYGFVVQADRLDYRLTSLAFRLDNVTVADRMAPDRPFAQAERLEVDLGAATLRGRLVFDRLAVQQPTVQLDPSTRPSLPAAGSTTSAAPASAPGSTSRPIEIRELEVNRLDFGMGTPGSIHIAARQLSTAMVGPSPGRLEGDVAIAGGFSIETDVARVAFDRADSHLILDLARLSLGGSLTARSPVSDLRVEGSAGLASDGTLDVTYAATGDLGEIGRWWSNAPPIEGHATLNGTARGPLTAPTVTFEVDGTNLAWAPVEEAALRISGRWTPDAVTLERFLLTSAGASLQAAGQLALDDRARSRLESRWTGLSTSLVAQLFGLPPGALPRTALAGSTDLAWNGSRPVAGGIEGRIEATAAGATTEDRSATGTAIATGRDSRWNVTYRQSMDGETEATLDGVVVLDDTQPASSRASGIVDVRSSDVRAALAQVRRLGVAIPGAADVVHLEGLAFHGALDGTVTAPHVSGRLTVDGAVVGELRDIGMQGDLALDGMGVEITSLVMENDGNRAVVDGTLPWRGETGEGTVEARLEQLEDLAAVVPARWRPAGTLDIAGRWTGSAETPAVTARVTGANVSIDGTTIDSVTADLAFSNDVLTVERLQLTQASGSLSASGSWNLGNGAVTLTMAGDGLSVVVAGESPESAASARASGVAVDLGLDGSLARLSGHATLTADGVETGGHPLGPIRARVEAADGTGRVTLEAPDHGATVEARITMEAPWTFDARVGLAHTDVVAFAPVAGLSDAPLNDMRAVIDATADVSGALDDPAASNATISITGIEGSVRGLPLTLAQPGRLALEDGAVRAIDDLRVGLGAAALSVTNASRAPGELVIGVEGPIEEMVSLVPGVVPEDIAAEGRVKAEIRFASRPSLADVNGTVTAEISSLRRGEVELAQAVRIEAGAQGGVITLHTLEGTVAGSPIEARGRAPLAWLTAGSSPGTPAPDEAPATFALRSTIDLGRMVTALSGESTDVKGTLELSVDGTALAPRLDAVRATLNESAGSVVLAGITFTERRPTELRLQDGLLHVEAFEWQTGDSELVASGTVGVAEGVDGRLDVKGGSSLALLNYVTPGRTDGEATFNLVLSGGPGARQLLGTIGVENGSLLFVDSRVALADWSGAIEFGENVIAIRNLRGQLNGGDAAINGRFPMAGADDASSTITVTVSDAFMDIPRGLRSQLDASLEWSGGQEDPRLTGEITITADAYREPVTALAAIAADLTAPGRGQALPLPSFLSETRLDVHVVTVGPLAMRNSFAQVEMQPDLQVVGTIGQPALSGGVVVADEGRILLNGRAYELRDSRITFSPEAGLVPRLDLSGETRVGTYTVYLRMTGPVSEFETALSSDPPLGERDLQTLLVTGQVGGQANSGQSDISAVGAVSSDVLGLAGQFLGLDSVQVGTADDLTLVSSDVKPALRLTVSKRLGSYFELVLSDNLDNSELTWVVIYRPRRGYQFRFLSRQNEDLTLEFRQEIEFGPGVAPPRRRSSARVQRERVGDVTVTGDVGFDEADVLDSVRLKTGSRFDFPDWLRDRERIAALYEQRGYFAARIVPTRRTVNEAGPEPTVALNYRITRGPATELRIEGYDPPAGVVRDLRDAWAQNVLIDLLDTDLADVMRDHLTDAGFLRAAVQVDVDEPMPNRVSAVVRVEPGPKSLTRGFAFSGNTAIADDALRAIADLGDLGDEAWKNPAPLVSAIENEYAARGYLAASATPESVQYADSTATMPIAIAEGEPTRVTRVRLNGVERVAEQDAVAATGLTVGAVYVAGTDQAARQRLQGWYRELGYRDVTVEARSQVQPDEARAEVTLEVREGPQYIVRGVRTTGVESTNRSLVERATRIEPGTPASPELATRTRRQLYNIGTFRSAELTYEPASVSPGEPTIPVDAVVTLQESRRFVLLYGVETTSQYDPLFDQRSTAGGFAADVRDRNFLGRGWAIGTGFRYEPKFKTARALFSVPRLWDRPIRTNVYGNLRQEDRTGSSQLFLRDKELSLSVEQRWRPTTPLELSWGYTFDDRDISFRVRDTGETILQFLGQLAELGSAIVVDRRNDLFDATRGWMVSASAGWGLQLLGSDFDYLRTLVRASYYQPVGPLTLASNVRWGNLKPIGGQPPLTVLDLFYQAGGTQTVRGYKQDSLSAYELLGVGVGGSKLFVVNQEVRFPLFWRLSGAAFADAGNTFTDGGGIVLSDMAMGYGMGLRIRTPLAPLRIDIGFPVPRRPGDRRYRWHFSIGQMF